MSFGFAIGDFILVTQLAWTVAQNARRACGAHDELTREVTNLHIVLQRLQHEVAAPASLLNQAGDNRQEEIGVLLRGCGKVLTTLSRILDKYNALPEEKRRVTRLWQRIRFGNGEMLDLANIRLELSTHTNAATLFVNLLILGSQGKVEQHMNNHSEELKHIRRSLDWISAGFHAATPEGTVWTSYVDDDKDVWRKFRRELIKDGFKSSAIERHKTVIIRYLTELGNRGVFDQLNGSGQTSFPEYPDPVCMDIVPHPLCSDSKKEKYTIVREVATPSDASQHSIDPYSYCLRHWDPREAPIRLVGSIFDMASLCEWIYLNIYAYDRLHASRVPLGSKPNRIATRIEELRGLLASFSSNLSLVRNILSQKCGSEMRTLQAFAQKCEEPPKVFQKFVDEGEKLMLCARINRRLGETQEDKESNEPVKLSEIEWRGRNAIEAAWKARPIERFGRRAGLDFVRNLAPRRDQVGTQAHSLTVLIRNLRKVELIFKRECEILCVGITMTNTGSVFDHHTQQGPIPSFSSSSSSIPSALSIPPQDRALYTAQESPVRHDKWREDIINEMGQAPIELSKLETRLRANSVSEADLEAEIVKLVIETRTAYPDGGKLTSSSSQHS